MTTVLTTEDKVYTLSLNHDQEVYAFGSFVEGKEFGLSLSLEQAEEIQKQLSFKVSWKICEIAN